MPREAIRPLHVYRVRDILIINSKTPMSSRNMPPRELDFLRREMGRLFDEFFPARQDEGGDSAVWLPRADLAEADDSYIISLDMPGVPRENINLSFEEGQLKIFGERPAAPEVEGAQFVRIERHFGRFYRAFNFATDVDPEKIDAKFKDGVLQITVGKASRASSRRIEVK
jgi:HSP20 family protein